MVSLQERLKNPPPFYALPAWRKIVVVCGLGFVLVVLIMSLNTELDIYGGDPDHLVAATGHIYPARVNHGYLRYATREEHDSLIFWQDKMVTWAGLSFLAGFLLCGLYRPKRQWPPRR